MVILGQSVLSIQPEYTAIFLHPPWPISVICTLKKLRVVQIIIKAPKNLLAPICAILGEAYPEGLFSNTWC